MSDIEQNKVLHPAAATEGDAIRRTAAPGGAADAKVSAAPANADDGGFAVFKRRVLALVGTDRMAKRLAGNQLRPVRGGGTALAGGLVAFLLMSVDAQFRWGVPVGILAMCVASFGVLDFLGTFDDPDDRVAKKTTIAELARPLTASASSLFSPLLFIGL